MNIDWSKCPQATHFAPKPMDDEMWCEVFWRVVDGVGVEAWAIEGGGLQHYSRPTWRAETAERLIARPSQWNGEGLPPIGMVCERSFSYRDWVTTTICGHSTDGAYAAFYDGDGHMGWSDDCKFRPIRTAEQIAAEEREKAIQRMLSEEIGLYRRIAELVYDAGYRKQVTP